MAEPPAGWKPVQNKQLSGGVANGPPEGADPDEFWTRVKRLMGRGFPQSVAIREARLEFLGIKEPVG